MHILRQPVDPVKAALARELRKNMTPAEQILWQHLRANRLDGLHFRRQQVIAGFIVDFYCNVARLVIEVDGPIHDDQKEMDAEREGILENLGFHIIRFTNVDVETDLVGILELIRRHIKDIKMKSG